MIIYCLHDHILIAYTFCMMYYLLFVWWFRYYLHDVMYFLMYHILFAWDFIYYFHESYSFCMTYHTLFCMTNHNFLHESYTFSMMYFILFAQYIIYFLNDIFRNLYTHWPTSAEDGHFSESLPRYSTNSFSFSLEISSFFTCSFSYRNSRKESYITWVSCEQCQTSYKLPCDFSFYI